MRNPDRQFPRSFKLVLGMLLGMAVAQVALAGPEEQAESIQANQANQAVAVPLTGLQVYNAVCIACHSPPGIGGAPALGDDDAWSARIAQGMDSLIHNALQGYSGKTGIMPKKGGRLDLSDEEIIGAIEYMVEQVAQ